MRRPFASLAAATFLLSSAVAMADDDRVGELQEINLDRGIIKVDNADFRLEGRSLDGLQIGDRVRVVYTQADEHDIPSVRTITKVEPRQR